MTASGKLDPTQARLKSHRSPEAAGADRSSLTDVRGRLRLPKRAVMVKNTLSAHLTHNKPAIHPSY